MKEYLTLEVHESVSPYAAMMEALKKYIDEIDSISFVEALPDEGETEHLYIVTTGEAYIWEDGWIELTGGTSGITGINVNGDPVEVINHVVDLLIPEKTSDIENDSGFITDAALDGYAKTEDIPTELSDLNNDMGYITEDALDGYALEDEIPTKVSALENDSGYITDADIPTKVSAFENDADYTTAEATKAEVAAQIAEIVAGAPESLDTLKEIADWIEHHEDDAAAMNTAIKEAQETATEAKSTAEDAKNSIPTKVSELENDSQYITDDALDEYATKDEMDEVESMAHDALSRVQTVEETAITAITVNGDSVPVENNTAAITVSGGESAIEHIQVNGEEQEIVDKTVNLAIDRASVDDETLVVGDTTGGGKDVYTGVLNDTVTVSPFSEGLITIAHEKIGGAVEVFIDVNGTVWDVAGGSVGSLVSFDVSDGTLTMTNNTGYDISYIIIT